MRALGVDESDPSMGALAGFPFVLACLLYSSMVGFVIAIGVLVWNGRLREGLVRSAKFAFRFRKAPTDAPEGDGAAEPEESSRRKGDTIPFGAAIAFGTLCAFFLSISGF